MKRLEQERGPGSRESVALKRRLNEAFRYLGLKIDLQAFSKSIMKDHDYSVGVGVSSDFEIVKPHGSDEFHVHQFDNVNNKMIWDAKGDLLTVIWYFASRFVQCNIDDLTEEMFESLRMY